MQKVLAVLAPQIGALSETFIRRHMEQLCPGKTIIIANNKDKPYAGNWDVDCPQLILNQLGRPNRNLLQRALKKVTDRLAPPKDPKLEAVEKFLQQHQVDVILGEYLDQSLPWLPLARSLGIPFYTHAHGYDVSICLQESHWQERYQQELGQATGIITMNRPSRQKLIDLGIPAEKIHVIHYGIEVPPQPPGARESKPIVRCLAVGRMVGKKAPILLLDAFRRASERCPNLRLDYVGTGALLPAVRQYLLAFNLADKVTLHGGQPNAIVCQLMQKADIFLQHSMTDFDSGDAEGLPVAILEAMGYALPIISTQHAGIPEEVLDGETGFLVAEGDSATMAEKIVCLAQDAETRLRFGRAAWERAKDNFTWEKEKQGLRDLMGLE